MSIESDHEKRLAQLESILQNEELTTKEDLKKVEKNFLADELKAKDKLLTKTITILIFFIVTPVYIYLIFQAMGAPNFSELIDVLIDFLKGK